MLDEEAVVEVPCFVDANGAHPAPVAPLPLHATGLVLRRQSRRARSTGGRPSGSRARAVKAFALHPLVDSVTVARRLVDGYTGVHPALAYLR